MQCISITEATFDKLVYTRKSEGYRKAIEIAKLLLLQYHPDVSKGRNNVLALMFDMNKLWEQFVYVSLKKHAGDINVTAQTSKHFWQADNGGQRSTMRPDIVINKDSDTCVVLDTKWKNLSGYNPSPNDLRQMYVYHEYYRANKVALVYPGVASAVKGTYFDRKTEMSDKECSVLTIPIENDIRTWQKSISDYLVGQFANNNVYCE